MWNIVCTICNSIFQIKDGSPMANSFTRCMAHSLDAFVQLRSYSIAFFSK